MTLRSLAAATLLLVASLAQAADAKTYTVVFREQWKVGDVVTRESTETETTDVVVKVGEQVVQENHSTQTTSYRLVLKCLELDGATPVKRLVYLVSWRLEGKGGPEELMDESLTGCHVELTGKEGGRAWKVLTPGKEISEIAKGWLDRKFGPEAKEANELLLEPKEPQAPGSSWSPDVEALAKDLGGALEVDVSKSTMKMGFVEVQTTPAGEFGKFTMDLDFQTKALPSPMGAMPWKEGGVMKGRGILLRGLAPGAFDEEKAMEMTILGVAEAQGALVNFSYKGKGKDAQAAGGELPAVPTAAPTTPAAPK